MMPERTPGSVRDAAFGEIGRVRRDGGLAGDRLRRRTTRGSCVRTRLAGERFDAHAHGGDARLHIDFGDAQADRRRIGDGLAGAAAEAVRMRCRMWSRDISAASTSRGSFSRAAEAGRAGSARRSPGRRSWPGRLRIHSPSPSGAQAGRHPAGEFEQARVGHQPGEGAEGQLLHAVLLLARLRSS